MKTLHKTNLTNLQTAITTNTDIQAKAYKFYQDALFGCTLIESYYIIKAVKLAEKDFFSYTYNLIKTDKTSAALVNILTNIHNSDSDNHDDYLVAYNGLGNIQAYIAEVQTILGLAVQVINKQA